MHSSGLKLIAPDSALSQLYQPQPGILHLPNVYYKTPLHFRYTSHVAIFFFTLAFVGKFREVLF